MNVKVNPFSPSPGILKYELALQPLEPERLRNHLARLGQTRRTVGEAEDVVVEGDTHDLAKAERDDREVVAAQPQHRRAERDTGQARQHAAAIGIMMKYVSPGSHGMAGNVSASQVENGIPMTMPA